jgi:putative NADPH-quinone reductase
MCCRAHDSRMGKHRIAIIQGHPDPKGGHFGHALAAAYAQAASGAGHEVRTVDIAQLQFPLLRSAEEFEHGAPPPAIAGAQDTIRWADHLVMFFPLWLGTMPALVKAFLEQVFRPGFAMDFGQEGKLPRRLLAGRSARIVVTMGMPGVLYRWFFRAHGLRGLERSILGFSGIKPVRDTLVGLVGVPAAKGRKRWLQRMQALGRKAA